VRVCGRSASFSTISSRGFGVLNFRTVDGGSEDGRWSAKCEGDDDEGEPQAETLIGTEDFGVLETRYLVMSRSPFAAGEILGEGWADRGGHVQLWAAATCIPSRQLGRARVAPDSAARIGRFRQQSDDALAKLFTSLSKQRTLAGCSESSDSMLHCSMLCASVEDLPNAFLALRAAEEEGEKTRSREQRERERVLSTP
jgi:hypothetical protein